MKTLAFAVLVGVNLAAGPSVNAKETLLEKNRARMAAITPAEYDASTLLVDDSMSTVAVVTTRPAYKTKAKTWESETDTWLQGGVNKKTGETLLQIGGSIFYTDQWRFYELATYSTLNGPVDAPITANRRVIGCSGGCKFVEDRREREDSSPGGTTQRLHRARRPSGCRPRGATVRPRRKYRR